MEEFGTGPSQFSEREGGRFMYDGILGTNANRTMRTTDM